MPQPLVLQPAVAIVVAAGSGSRLGAGMPKALVEVAGVPLVVRSVRQLAAGGVGAVVVVVPADERAAFEAVLASAPIPVTIVAGGAERQHSVANGLAALDSLHASSPAGMPSPRVLPDAAALPDASGDPLDDLVVLVHDAARAFVPAAVVARVIDAVRSGSSAVVPVIPVSDSIREVHDAGSTVVNRSRLRAIQTPQGFARGVLVEAHAALADTGTIVTDDAAAAEYLGHDVTLVEGSRYSFKVTDPFDLLIAEAFAASTGEQRR
ncbi:MAG: 2-C-methyl-D-erythritol 4-phosphate cytidylyltransferase [Propioniciclava sp.]|uniref:IspD/TarI family cytidylyltransferase n=1 Tax=Propioniciclava sp. TaxID=2038686 RepID=UPI0039E3EBD8